MCVFLHVLKRNSIPYGKTYIIILKFNLVFEKKLKTNKFQQFCPSGLVFNPRKLWCDWPFNVPECNSSTSSTSIGTSTVSSTTTDQFSTTETDATSIDPTTSTTFPSSSESTSTVITSTRLPTTSYECPSSDGNYPDPKSCLSYYTCSNGYPYIMVSSSFVVSILEISEVYLFAVLP